MKKQSLQNNSLNLIKLIAALQVMFGHIVVHLEISIPSWISQMLGVFQGVPIFFTLSGFLIWFSIDRSANRRGYSTYLRKRFWRIYPEMWVAVVIEIIVMCILYRRWNVRDTALFTVTQATIFQFWTPDSLRGYGCGTPNGALWTMGVTIQFYIIAWFLYRLLKNKKLQVWIGAIAGCLALSIIGQIGIDSFHNDILSKLYGQIVIKYLWMFLVGMAGASFQDVLVPVLKKWWPIIFIVGVIVSITGFDIKIGYHVLKTITILMAVIGFSYQFPKLKMKRDISFGIFIYHMTVVNAMITFGYTGKLIWFFTATLISCVLGYISTVTIGQYAARRKIKIR